MSLFLVLMVLAVIGLAFGVGFVWLCVFGIGMGSSWMERKTERVNNIKVNDYERVGKTDLE